jgi:hypothetical protein
MLQRDIPPPVPPVSVATISWSVAKFNRVMALRPATNFDAGDAHAVYG